MVVPLSSKSPIAKYTPKPIPPRPMEPPHLEGFDSVAARVKEFCRVHEKHGKGVVNKERTWVYYPDGATSDANPQGLLSEPSHHEKERIKSILIYRRIIESRAKSNFQILKQQLTEQAKRTTISNEEMEKLKELKATYLQAAADVRHVEELMWEAPQAVEHREWEAQMEEERIEAERKLRAI